MVQHTAGFTVVVDSYSYRPQRGTSEDPGSVAVVYVCESDKFKHHQGAAHLHAWTPLETQAQFRAQYSNGGPLSSIRRCMEAINRHPRAVLAISHDRGPS